MDIPAIGVKRPGVTGVAAAIAAVRSCTRPIQFPVQSNPNTVEIHRRRFVCRARRERSADFSQAIVEIFQSSGPARRDGKFGARTESPSLAYSQDLVLVTRQVRVLEEPSLRPSESTGCVEQPLVERITSPAAHRRDEVEFFSNSAERSRSSRNDAVIEIVRKRNISFNSDEQPRGQEIIVA